MKKLQMTTLLCALMVFTGTVTGGCTKAADTSAEGLQKSAQESAMQEYLETASTGGAQDKVPDPTTPELKIVSVFIPSEKGIIKEMEAIEVLDENLLFAKLKEYEVVPEAAEIVSFEHDTDTGRLSLKGVDINDKRLMVAVGNTFIENFELATMTIDVDGESTADTTDMKYNMEYKKMMEN